MQVEVIHAHAGDSKWHGTEGLGMQGDCHEAGRPGRASPVGLPGAAMVRAGMAPHGALWCCPDPLRLLRVSAVGIMPEQREHNRHSDGHPKVWLVHSATKYGGRNNSNSTNQSRNQSSHLIITIKNL